MTRRSLALIAALVAGAVAMAACGDNVEGSGTLTATLQTPNADDGAVLIRIEGPGFSNVQASSGAYLLYWRLASENELRVLVLGNLNGGPLFTVETPGGTEAADYQGAVLQAASRGDAERGSLAGYGLQVSITH